MSRFMTLLVLSLVLVCTASVFEVAAQSVPGHVYTVRYHKAFEGKEAEYNAFYAEAVRPVFDKLKADGDIVSYLDLQEFFGDRDATHVVIMEFENMAALDDYQAKFAAAVPEVLGMSAEEALADLPTLRKYTGTEIFGSTQAN